MTSIPSTASMTVSQPGSQSGSGLTSWLRRAERWLDDHGKGAWIAATVLAFIFAWPVGLGLLAYMIWSKRMFKSSSCAQNWSKMKEHQGHHPAPWTRHGAMRSSGNAAFDAYKSETLRRLEEEQAAFEAFLQRLREAKDKSEFDNFMEDRARAARAPTEAANANPTPLVPPVPPAPETRQSGSY